MGCVRMSEELEQLREERSELWERAKRFLAERTSAEEPVLRGEDEYRYYEMVGGIMRLGQRIKELEAWEQLVRACEHVSRFVTGAAPRVLTYEEVRKLQKNSVQWFEFKDAGVYHQHLLAGYTFQRWAYEYGKEWRVWERKPSPEDTQREEWDV